MKTWQNLEDYARDLAELRWKKQCNPQHIMGVDFDGVIEVSSDELVLLEITKEKNLDKVRADINKINTVKHKYMTEGIFCRGFVILEQEPTNSMREAGKGNHIKVCSIHEFEKEYYNFEEYHTYREKYPFGSAVDSQTGKNDIRQYIEVNYEDIQSHKSYNIQKIVDNLLNGTHIVLIGDYGTGKSRCVKEIYELLSKSIQKAAAYPLAINLKDHWSSSNAVGIIADHLGGLGLSTSIDHTIQMLNSGNLILLLDGFDEVGTQIHDPRLEDRKSIRKKAVSGVRDLIAKSKRGVLITGRSHFFDSQEEMIESLGLSNKQESTLLLSVPDSFSSAEAKKYLHTLGVFVEIPDWLPKKPLVFQILVELNKTDLTNILSKEFSQYTFWTSFVLAVCRRESSGVKETISPSTILQILYELASKTRYSKEFLGRLSPSDIDAVYKNVVGSVPDENGRQLLARMCMLGKIDPSSPDRQFVDASVLEILRATSLINIIVNMDINEENNTQWRHSLRELGLIHAANIIDYNDLLQQCFIFIEQFSNTRNTKCLGEIISILSIMNNEEINMNVLILNNSNIPILNLSDKIISNLTIQNSEIGILLLNNTSISEKSNLLIKNCIIDGVSGITNEKGLPIWIENCETINFDMVNNATRIKESTLKPSQKLFLSIIQKIFFQKGKGRDERTLYRGGYGQNNDSKLVGAILKILLQETVIEKVEKDGNLYKPVRKYTSRMEKIRAELTLSDDDIWKAISDLD